MGHFASETTVPVEKTRAEIETTLMRYGASEFHSGWKEGQAMIAFRLGDLFIRFVLPIPARDDKKFTHKKSRYGNWEKRTDLQAAKVWDQEVRQRWRALHLVIKAKLEAVECAISTIEQEFLAFIVMPNQITVGEWIMSDAIPQIRAGQMPTLMLPSPPPEDVEDAEFTERS
jgi:hypothetical protein